MAKGPGGGMTISRRDLLRGVGAIVAAGTVAPLAGCALDPESAATLDGAGRPVPLPADPALAAGKAHRPNLVVVVSDDHRWDALGTHPAHPPFLETPRLDQLAAEGAQFTEAFVTTSLCSPSRASIVTGRYACTHGVRNNVTPWDDATTTFFEPLARAGYRNAFIGKWHMPGRLPRLRGVEQFTTFVVEAGQGRYLDCPLVVNGVTEERPGTYVTTDLTDRAIDFLRDQQAGTPFCLVLAHKAVHHQFIPPPDVIGRYDGAQVTLPPESYTTQTFLDRNVWEGASGRLDVAYRRYLETLYGMDREVGRLVDEIDRLGFRERTLVVYLTDNGYSWGEHTLTGKRWATEENLRVPLIVRWPGTVKAGIRVDRMALNVDLAPTLLDAAGLDVPTAMPGRSWVPLLGGSGSASTSWRQDFRYEYFEDFPYQVPTHQALRTDRWLYVEYERGFPPALFDIRADPRTQQDLAGTPVFDRVAPALAVRLQELRDATPGASA